MSFTSIIKLVLLSAFCCVLIAFRIFVTDTKVYLFMFPNLILAWIPLILAWLAYREGTKTKLYAYILGWLAFFPNAPYIITDLIHLRPRNDFPLWFDSILIYSFAFTGFIVGMLSAIIIYQKLKKIYSRLAAKVFMLCAMLLSGYAIYLGRFLRWNSWDIVGNPHLIILDTLTCITDPFHHTTMYGVTAITGILLILVFLLLESFIPKEETIT